MGVITRQKKWPAKNLGAIISFLDQLYPSGIPIEDVAKRMNITAQAISNMFRRDDMKLSKAEEIYESFGYRLKLFYPERNYSDGYVPLPPRFEYPQAGNLSGLVKYIQDSEYSVTFVAEQTGVTTVSIRKAFQTGDIIISRLYHIVETLGISVFWEYEKIDKQN